MRAAGVAWRSVRLDTIRYDTTRHACLRQRRGGGGRRRRCSISMIHSNVRHEKSKQDRSSQQLGNKRQQQQQQQYIRHQRAACCCCLALPFSRSACRNWRAEESHRELEILNETTRRAADGTRPDGYGHLSHLSLSLFFIFVLFCFVDLLLEALIDKQQRVSVRRRPDGRTDGRSCSVTRHILLESTPPPPPCPTPS